MPLKACGPLFALFLANRLGGEVFELAFGHAVGDFFDFFSGVAVFAPFVGEGGTHETALFFTF